MAERVVMASAFKARCLALLDQVAETKVPVVVTKRGKPVARVVPMGAGSESRATLGSITLLAEEDDAYFSTGATWDAESAEDPR